MRYLSLVEILVLHEAIIASTGGARGIRDVGTLLQLGNGKVDDVGYDGLIVETDDENGDRYSHCRKQHAERGLLDGGGRS